MQPDSSSVWIYHFSLHMRITMNNNTMGMTWLFALYAGKLKTIITSMSAKSEDAHLSGHLVIICNVGH